MRSEKTGYKQLWAWLAVAMSAPLAHFSGGSWLALLVLGAICYGVVALVPNGVEVILDSRILCAMELIWIMLFLSQLMPLSAAYWPGEKSELAVPVVLLALGAYSCSNRPPRVAGVLFWGIVIMYVPVLIAGVKDVEPRWLLPDSMGISAWMVPVLLLPCMGRMVSDNRSSGWYTGMVSFGLILWLLTAGTLSPTVASGVDAPFREVSRSLTIGAASRFESLIAVAVTFGWFCLGSFLIHGGKEFCEGLGLSGKTAPWLIAAGAYGVQLVGVKIPGKAGAAIAVLLWVIVPIVARKISLKKIEKSA